MLAPHDHDDLPGLLSAVFDTDFFRHSAWALQEKLKGVMITNSAGGSNHGGWGFNARYNKVFFAPIRLSPEEANALRNTRLSDERIRIHPFFNEGGHWLRPLYDPERGQPDIAYICDFLDNPQGGVRNRLLAQMFPARTLAAGRVSVSEFDRRAGQGRNTDMQSFTTNGWPAERGSPPEWLHSDFLLVAYEYVHNLFDAFVEEGDLK